MTFKKLLVLIPSRNRAELAKNAIDSVLNQKNSIFQLVVSDNSNDINQIDILRDFCLKIEDERLKYINPPKSLPMTDHWNWAMSQVIETESFSHILFLSDRYVFIDNALAELENILRQFPDKIVSYCTNSIDDSNENSVFLTQKMWSGEAFNIESSQMIKWYANIHLPEAMPRMVNCAVPIKIVKTIKENFNDYFSSVAPDFNFLGRILDTVDSFYFYDKALFVNYGLSRSSGRNVLSGNFQKDATDFIENLETTQVNFPTPVNDIRIMPNAVMHEYYDVRLSSKLNKFPEMNREQYYLSLVENIFNYKNEAMKKNMLENIVGEIGKDKFLIYQVKGKLKRYLKAIEIRLYNIFNASNPYILRKEFPTVEQALDFAKRNLRKRSSNLRFADERIGVSKINQKDLIQIQ